LIVDNGFLPPLIPPAATGTLSITYKGSLFADNEEPLLILIVAPSGEPPPLIL
jgi:hypothetical protein